MLETSVFFVGKERSLLQWPSVFEFVIGGINALEALGKILTSANLTLKDWGGWCELIS